MFNEFSFNEQVFAPGVVYTNIPLVAAQAYAYAPQLFVAVNIDMSSLEFPVSPASAIASAFAVFNSVMLAPCAKATARGETPNHAIALSHAVYQAQYSFTPRQINRAYVIGTDSYGNMVYGEDEDTAAVVLYGECLRMVPEPMVTSAADANIVAANIISKSRLSNNRGMILIPPNCGIEVGDVVEIDDTNCNQESETYRVNGWQLEYNPRRSTFHQIVQLTGV